ncbi:MAG: (S)-ureidoglycine aminohydrolase [Janthinobacterium lividum]
MSLHRLGETRSRRAADHLLQTPDTFVWAPLPGMKNATACVHAAPALGAAFAAYTVHFQPGGSLGVAAGTRLIYGLEGTLQLSIEGREVTLGAGGYAYLPPASEQAVTAGGEARAVVFEKPYQPLPDMPAPEAFAGSEGSIPGMPLNGDDALLVRALLPPNDTRFDFAVNTMEYQPGASLSMVESHVMEHGLLMLEGGGIYRLGDAWYPVAAGDFIWMAPFCPQWFGALGKRPARYLIYKDRNRHPLQEASPR